MLLKEDAALIRLGKEKSRAMDSRFYGDPANHVEFESEIKHREAARQKRQQKRKSNRKGGR